jgi:hypothetical protein
MVAHTSSLRFVSKISFLCFLIATVALSGIHPARAESREQVVDQITDLVFYSVNPSLRKRKLKTSDRYYIREWNRIRAVVDPRIQSAAKVCLRTQPDYLWEFGTINGQSYDQTYDDIADVVFHSRHPELNGQKIPVGDKALAHEWANFAR